MIVWLFSQRYLFAKSNPGTAHVSDTKLWWSNLSVHTKAYGVHDMLNANIIKQIILVILFSCFCRDKLLLFILIDLLSLSVFFDLWKIEERYNMYKEYIFLSSLILLYIFSKIRNLPSCGISKLPMTKKWLWCWESRILRQVCRLYKKIRWDHSTLGHNLRNKRKFR